MIQELVVKELLVSFLMVTGCQIYFTDPNLKYVFTNHCRYSVDESESSNFILTSNQLFGLKEKRDLTLVHNMLNGHLTFGSNLEKLPQSVGQLMEAYPKAKFIVIKVLEETGCDSLKARFTGQTYMGRIDNMFICRLNPRGSNDPRFGLVWNDVFIEQFTTIGLASLPVVISEMRWNNVSVELMAKRIFPNITPNNIAQLFWTKQYCPSECIQETEQDHINGWVGPPLISRTLQKITWTRVAIFILAICIALEYYLISAASEMNHGGKHVMEPAKKGSNYR